MELNQQKLHVAIVSSPGMGHLIPVLLLGHRLATVHHLHVTVLAVTTETSAAESQLMDTAHTINIVKIPLGDLSSLLNPHDAVVTHLAVMMRQARHGIRCAISAMARRPDVLIADLFSSESLPIADEFRLQKYVYVPCSARFVSLITYCQVLDKDVKGQYVDRTEPLVIPGCDPVRCEDVPDPMLDRNDQQYKEFVRMGIDFVTLSDGILMNTWTDFEGKRIKALKNNEILRSVVKVPVYDIGPLTREADEAGLEKSKAIEWLDKQPVGSVLFVSFGSGGTLSAEQTTELASGLELSQQRFLWVIRPPVGSSTDGAFFTAGTGPDGPPDYLPEGFLTRTQNVGLLWTTWAPQVEILNHRSIGGFLTHCGLNSVFESIKGGVPMIAWPLYAEQRLNASIVTEEMKVGVRPAVLPTKKVVGREEIEKMARRLMESEEGKKMRERE
ncbi:hypothetical protein OSB04_027545 [Centaurea solstitialis]|uniref:Glycosyltransferase n=1 Tax=Centaurea solstitialis TaxID=347529 RepID=A0AA38W8D9_9ASTR|nr:hypothetical protein OSB04_027545 [Centaurea solstitialis]